MSVYKYSDWSFGEVEALLNVVGEDNARALIAGTLTLKRGDGELVVSEAGKDLFDRNGRRVPPPDLRSAVCDANRNFCLTQPAIDCGLRLARIGEHLQTGPTISAAEFEVRSRRLLEWLAKDEQCRNSIKGVHLPICIPRTALGDYGRILDRDFLPGVERSYQQEFPSQKFYNYRKGNLAGKVTIVPGTRHEALVSKLAEGPVVGIYFPNPLPGFSVHAQREQITTLPPEFLLAGGFDTVTAMVAYPDVLARDFNTPGLDMSALQWQSPGCSLVFRARDVRLYFDYSGGLGYARGGCSGVLLFVG